MIAHAIFFYIFSFIAIISAVMVTVSKNTVHSVFFFNIRFYKYFMFVHNDRSRIFRYDNVNCVCGCSCSFILICCNDVKCSATKKINGFYLNLVQDISLSD